MAGAKGENCAKCYSASDPDHRNGGLASFGCDLALGDAAVDALGNPDRATVSDELEFVAAEGLVLCYQRTEGATVTRTGRCRNDDLSANRAGAQCQVKGFAVPIDSVIKAADRNKILPVDQQTCRRRTE